MNLQNKASVKLGKNDSVIPTAEDCVIRNLIDRQASENPDAVIIKFEDGTQWTCSELHKRVIAHAAGLQRLGVGQGDMVITWLPNGPTAVTLLLALNYIGAINVPINTGYKGGVLQHVINNCQARLMIADGRLIDRLEDIDVPNLQDIVIIGEGYPELKNKNLLSEASLIQDGDELQPLLHPIQPYDTHVVIYTSGTTGPSKGVLASYVHTHQTAINFRHVGPGDCNLMVLPMFHIGGVISVYWPLLHSGQAAVIDSFKTDLFWDRVRTMGVTTVGLLGAMVQFLMKQPAAEDERNHPLKTVVIVPMNDDALAFGRRFGVEVYTEYNMTELSVPLYEGPNPSSRGSCGKPRDGVELRLVDDHDLEVPTGETGELIVRFAMPWATSHGYLNNTEATAAAWRNGWFHTGDLFRKDANDNYYFIDRAKDALRRRGENISSFEVEVEILAHPAVREAAVVGVSGAGSEDDVLAVLAPVDGSRIDPVELLEFLQSRLAHFMIPRYIRILDALPKTPTQKVQKHLLRSQGVTADTWDRETAGISFKREKLGTR